MSSHKEGTMWQGAEGSLTPIAHKKLRFLIPATCEELNAANNYGLEADPSSGKFRWKPSPGEHVDCNLEESSSIDPRLKKLWDNKCDFVTGKNKSDSIWDLFL